MIILFIITRLLDMVTTLLNIYKYGGWEVEMNPLVRSIGEKGIYYFMAYQLLVIILALVIVDKFKYENFVFGTFSIISTIAVVINIWCLTL